MTRERTASEIVDDMVAEHRKRDMTWQEIIGSVGTRFCAHPPICPSTGKPCEVRAKMESESTFRLVHEPVPLIHDVPADWPRPTVGEAILDAVKQFPEEAAAVAAFLGALVLPRFERPLLALCVRALEASAKKRGKEEPKP